MTSLVVTVLKLCKRLKARRRRNKRKCRNGHGNFGRNHYCPLAVIKGIMCSPKKCCSLPYLPKHLLLDQMTPLLIGIVFLYALQKELFDKDTKLIRIETLFSARLAIQRRLPVEGGDLRMQSSRSRRNGVVCVQAGVWTWTVYGKVLTE